MAERVFLHVGTMKSGTSFLQASWWRNRDELARRGLLLPGRRRDHFAAAVLVGRHHPALAEFSTERSETWERLMAEIAAWPERALISHEIFSSANPAQAARALRGLEQCAHEVHVILTVRDLARQLPSHWQQAVKSRSSLTLTDYWQRVRDDAGHRFWTFHDVPAILDRWGQGIPADHVHVVVTPQDSSPDWLWQATCRLFGVDPAGLRPTGRRANEALGIAEVEVMRRVQSLIPADQRDLALTRLTKGPIARDVIARSGPAERFVPPAALHGWATERSAEVIAALRDRKYDVVGDLSDLAPTPGPAAGRTPDEVKPEEIADVAVESLARMVVRERDHRLEIARLASVRSRLRRRLRHARRSAAPARSSTPRTSRALAALGRRWQRVSSRGSGRAGPSAAGDAPAADVPE